MFLLRFVLLVFSFLYLGCHVESIGSLLTGGAGARVGVALFDDVCIAFWDVSIVQIYHHGLVVFEVVDGKTFAILANHIGWIRHVAKNNFLELPLELSLFFLFLKLISHGVLATPFHLGCPLLQCLKLLLHFYVVGVGVVCIGEDSLNNLIEVLLVYLDGTRIIQSCPCKFLSV